MSETALEPASGIQSNFGAAKTWPQTRLAPAS